MLLSQVAALTSAQNVPSTTTNVDQQGESEKNELGWAATCGLRVAVLTFLHPNSGCQLQALSLRAALLLLGRGRWCVRAVLVAKVAQLHAWMHGSRHPPPSLQHKAAFT